MAESPQETSSIPDGAVGRLGSAAFRGGNLGCDFSFQAGGSLLSMCGSIVWNVSTRQRHELSIEELGVGTRVFGAVSFSRDGSVVASMVREVSSERPHVACWEVESEASDRSSRTGRVRLEVRAEPIGTKSASVVDFALSPDGRFLAITRSTKPGIKASRTILSVWDTAKAELLWEREFEGSRSVGTLDEREPRGEEPFELSFSSDGRTLLGKTGTASGPFHLKLWRTTDGETLNSVEGPLREFGIELQSSGVVTAFAEDRAKAETVLSPVLRHAGWTIAPIPHGCMHPDVRRLAEERFALLSRDRRWQIDASGFLTGRGAVSGDGRLVAWARQKVRRCEYEGPITLFDLSTGEMIRGPEVSRSTVSELALSEHGDRLSITTTDGAIQIYERAGDDAPWLALGSWPGHWADITSVAWRPDGKVVATADRSGTIILWDANTLEEERRLRPVETHYKSSGHHLVLWSADGSVLATVSHGNRDADKVHLYDRDGTSLLGVLPGFSRRVVEDPSESLSNGDTVVFHLGWSAGRSWSRVLPDVEGAAWKQPLRFASVDTILDESDGTRTLRRALDGKVLGQLSPSVNSANASPDGRLVAQSQDYGVSIHVAEAGDLIFEILFRSDGPPYSQTERVRAIRFAPDGDRVAVALESGEIRVYSTATKPQASQTERELYRFAPPHPSRHGAASFFPLLVFSPDGKRLATGGPHGKVFVWDVEGDQERGASVQGADRAH